MNLKGEVVTEHDKYAEVCIDRPIELVNVLDKEDW